MQIPAFLQKFGRDLVYLSAIGGILGWILVEREHQTEFNQMLFNDMKTIGEITDRYTENIRLKLSSKIRSQKRFPDLLKNLFCR